MMISKDKLKELGIEWVASGKDGRQGYFRRISENRSIPSLNQAQHQLLFSQTSYELYGSQGVEARPDGTVISKHAAQLGKLLKGTGKPKKEPSLQEKLIKLILST